MTCTGDADEDEHEDEDEDLSAVSHPPSNEGEEARREDAADSEWATNGNTASHAPGSEGEEAEREEVADTAWANMSRAEALEVLELAPDATPDAIREAHQRVIQRIHPDHGGSRYLAAAVDRAKVVLLG